MSKTKAAMSRFRTPLLLPAAITFGLCFILPHAVAPTYAASGFDDCVSSNMPAWPGVKRAQAMVREYTDNAAAADAAGNPREQVFWLRKLGAARRKAGQLSETSYAQARDCRNGVSARLEEEGEKKRRATAEENKKRDQDAARRMPSKLSGELLRLGYKDALYRGRRKLIQRAPAVGIGLLGYRSAKDATGLLSDGGGWRQKLESVTGLLGTLNLLSRKNTPSKRLTADALSRTSDIQLGALGQLEAAFGKFDRVFGQGTYSGNPLGLGGTGASSALGLGRSPSGSTTFTSQFDAAINRIGQPQGSGGPIGTRAPGHSTTSQIDLFSRAMDEVARRHETRVAKQRAEEDARREQAAERERVRRETAAREQARREQAAVEERNRQEAAAREAERARREGEATRRAELERQRVEAELERQRIEAEEDRNRQALRDSAQLDIDRLTMACHDDICCRSWFGEGKDGYRDLGIEECRGYAPLWRDLEHWCEAKNHEPEFCR